MPARASCPGSEARAGMCGGARWAHGMPAPAPSMSSVHPPPLGGVLMVYKGKESPKDPFLGQSSMCDGCRTTSGSSRNHDHHMYPRPPQLRNIFNCMSFATGRPPVVVQSRAPSAPQQPFRTKIRTCRGHSRRIGTPSCQDGLHAQRTSRSMPAT